jgi:hypothetical protein
MNETVWHRLTVPENFLLSLLLYVSSAGVIVLGLSWAIGTLDSSMASRRR